jgi:hypothetical protein
MPPEAQESPRPKLLSALETPAQAFRNNTEALKLWKQAREPRGDHCLGPDLPQT